MIRNKLNTLAFTVAELVGIIVILSLLLIITVPNVINTVERVKTKQWEKLVSDIKTAADTYVSIDPELFPELKNANGKAWITLNELVNNGLLKKPLTDPRTNEELDYETSVSIEKISNNDPFVYTYPSKDVQSKKLLTETLYENIVSSGDGYYSNGRFKGQNPNNWLYYDGYLWRIINYNSTDKIIRVIFEGKYKGSNQAPDELGRIESMEFDTSRICSTFTGCHDYDKLLDPTTTQSNYSNLSKDSDIKIYLNKWFSDNIASRATKRSNICIKAQSSITNDETDLCSVRGSSSEISLLTMVDYVSARLTDADKKNYLTSNIYDYWTLTADNSDASKVWVINTDGDLISRSASYSSLYGVRPVINIDDEALYVTGNGSLSKPYEIRMER